MHSSLTRPVKYKQLIISSFMNYIFIIMFVQLILQILQIYINKQATMMKNKAIDITSQHLFTHKEELKMIAHNFGGDFRSCSPRIFKRSRQSKIRQEQTSQKKKCQPTTQTDKMVCYISLENLMQSQQKTKRDKNQKQMTNRPLNTKISKKGRASTSPDLKQGSQSNEKNEKNRHRQSNIHKLTDPKQCESLNNLRQQITELKEINKILNEQLSVLKNQKQCQIRISHSLQQKINQLTSKLKDSGRMMKNYEREVIKVKAALDEHSSIDFKKLEDFFNNQEENDINEEFDESSKSQTTEKVEPDFNLFDPKVLQEIQKKLPEKCSVIENITQRDAIYELQTKIKYLQIEVSMLKRYKINYEKMEAECLGYRSQVRAFKKKAVLLAQQNQAKKHSLEKTQRISVKNRQKQSSIEIEDSSLSFELSKDSTPFQYK